MTIQIPSDMGKAREVLIDVDRIVNSKEWERAAIVWAYVAPADWKDSAKYSEASFRKLGIPGLSSKRSVSKYRKAWQWLIDNGYAQPVEPGDEVDVPEVPWSDFMDHWNTEGNPGMAPEARREREDNRALARIAERAAQEADEAFESIADDPAPDPTPARATPSAPRVAPSTSTPVPDDPDDDEEDDEFTDDELEEARRADEGVKQYRRDFEERTGAVGMLGIDTTYSLRKAANEVLGFYKRTTDPQARDLMRETYQKAIQEVVAVGVEMGIEGAVDWDGALAKMTGEN